MLALAEIRSRCRWRTVGKEQRLYALPVWRETRSFTERERAVLNWTEHATMVARDHVPDAAYEDVRRNFYEAEVASLTLIIATINAWNRFGVALRMEHGHHTLSLNGERAPDAARPGLSHDSAAPAALPAG